MMRFYPIRHFPANLTNGSTDAGPAYRSVSATDTTGVKSSCVRGVGEHCVLCYLIDEHPVTVFGGQICFHRLHTEKEEQSQ